ncbi:MAG: energy transducer TonB [Deltaproteobacteria bacterium]|nr:MAG: energy transducer TonB [Deltaproteobacteria bacterium]
MGHGSPSGGTGNGSGSGSRSGTGSGFGSGSGSGAGSGQGESDGEVSRRGKGIWAKLFSSHGDRGAGGAGAPGRGGAGGIPRYAQNPKPPYPQEAREKGYQGEVLLRVEVLSDGRVGQIEIRRSSGHELLDRSALSTVKQWKFVPAQKGKDPVPLWVNIPVKFQLQ